ncbi:chromosome segregation protein SMC [Homoserinimonas sp. OAct 916]|uniref:chromosome segregation protein SMC n=1 Tax=Homoserinimonas sp. OAct 916 TaxID=2211450 RepID=UPI000DBE419E|nr:chromosome segregation protein SMC [Homoserinimonas sp. OAct 916]
MYLKSLTLKGFKSFAQPTTFAFEPGVTCVVGPNGSGKSNVVDALAWVMGEQGAKTLRGGKMEDVIFAGTSTRGPLGRAQVILTIDNSDGALPIEYTEVTISRTLFRNGASEYAINGQGCRLLDVQELLSDSGLGREMHVIVGQGQLDQVLRATPEERRGFIEEAAGILKHRRRKEKTLRKLEAMQANLTRLSDLAGELRRQLKPLGHQAEIAREAQTIAAIVRDARARLLADEVVSLRRTIADHSRTENERHSERIVLQEQLEQARLRIQHIEQAQVGDAVDEARRVSFGLEQVQERLRSLFTLANQRLALLGSQADGPGAEPGVSPQMIEDARAEVERLNGELAAAASRHGTAQAASAACRVQLDAMDEEIAEQSAMVSRHDLEISQLTGRADAAASALAAVRGEVLRQQNAFDQASGRLEAARAHLAEAEDERADADFGRGDLDEGHELAKAEVFAAQAEIERLRDELHAGERERDALAAKASALSSALGHKDGSSALVEAKVPGVRGLVAEHVQVRAGFELAIAAALGTLADAVLAETHDDAVNALRTAQELELGRVELVVAEAAAATHVPDSFGSGARSAAGVVTAPPGVLGLLATTVIADDLAVARRVWADRAENRTTMTIITLAGEVLSEYVLRGGTGARRSRLELFAERDAATERLTEVTATIDELRVELSEQRAAHTQATQRAQAALAALREFDDQQTAHTDRLNRFTVQQEASLAECGRLQAALDVAAVAVDEALAAQTKTAAELEKARSKPRPILDVSARDALYAELEGARELEVQARLEVETTRERIRAQQARVQSFVDQLESERAQAQEAARLAVIRRRQADAATDVIDALPTVLASVDGSVAEAQRLLAVREAERASQNEELIALRATENGLRERLATITENVHGLELQIYERKLHLSSLLERAGSELGLIEEVLVAEYGPNELIPDVAEPDAPTDRDQAADEETEPAGIPFDRDQQKARLAKAERKLAQLGRVNPLALEEFAALEQRHAFLTEQLTDLANTRKDLLTIIDEIDEKMQAIFGAAFEDTRAAFADVFPVLFPGGTGSISLTDPNDLLGTGIEVSVKPAGKKIERLSLLSGGERSLAAVAFLIAIFKARPSPFYVLDEVEAALDDANLGRLLATFEDLRATSQLIVITHQKRTMEIADALYGVSMRQDGVSAVVGQRVEVAERAS